MTIENFKINKDRPLPNNALTWARVSDHINKLSLSQSLTDALTKKARAMSPGAWRHFLKNINTHIANITRSSNEQGK